MKFDTVFISWKDKNIKKASVFTVVFNEKLFQNDIAVFGTQCDFIFLDIVYFFPHSNFVFFDHP